MNAQPIPSGRRLGVHAVVDHLFALSTVLFVLGGAAIVVAQAVLIVAAQGTTAKELAEVVGPYVFGVSSVAGLLAFVLSYFRTGGVADDD